MESAIEDFVWIANYYHRLNSISRQELRRLEDMGIEPKNGMFLNILLRPGDTAIDNHQSDKLKES